MAQTPSTPDWIEKAIAYGVGIAGLATAAWKIIQGRNEEKRLDKDSDAKRLEELLALAEKLTHKEDSQQAVKDGETIQSLVEQLRHKTERLEVAQESIEYMRSRIADHVVNENVDSELIKNYKETIEALQIRVARLEAEKKSTNEQ